MSDISTSEELRSSLTNLKTWLASRDTINADDRVTIQAPEALRVIGFVDLQLERFDQCHHDNIIFSLDVNTQKAQSWTELNHLVSWSEEFYRTIINNRNSLTVLDLMKGHDDYPISKARHHIDECLEIIKSAINFDVGLDITHPDTRAQNYAVTNLLVDDSISLVDLIRHIFAALYSKCVVNLVVKSSQFVSATLASLLVDLMYKSGASKSEIECLAFDRRDSLGSEMRFLKTIGTRKGCKLSTIAAVFKETDTFAAAQEIIESYFREQYPNLIVLVEESSYERFIKDWQRYYSHALRIGCRLDPRTSVVDVYNEKIQVDLTAIDMKQSHKMAGHAINVLKFRTLADLTGILSCLRKVPYMTLWNDDLLLLREFCLKINICQEFWLNHVPKSVAGRQFPDDMANLLADAVAPDMADLYNFVAQDFGDELVLIRKMQVQFVKKDARLRTNLIVQAYSTLIGKNKSLKNGISSSEAIARLRRFQVATLHSLSSNEPGDSRIEIIRKPVGLAILVVREEMSLKTRPVLVDLIFKNLLLGNGVLLVCPQNALGAKFSLENDHVIPFKMVHDAMPDLSRLSLDSTVDSSATIPEGPLDSSQTKKLCPNNSFAMEVRNDMSAETCEAYTVCLGTRSKRIWFPDTECAKYWSIE